MFSNIKLIPAPMASLTDLPLREIYIEFGAKVVVSEMISSEALYYGKPSDLLIRSLSQHDHSDGSYIFGAQIFGSDKKKMVDAACFISQFPVDFIDINAGCPVKKVISQHSGAYLMKDYERLFDICEAVKASTSLPITVKIRIGLTKIADNITEICKRLESIGISALFVHARTRDEWFSGECHWDILKKITSAINIPLFANGSIDSKDYSDAVIDKTSANGVMIGRYAAQAPWIFSSWAGKSLKIDRKFVAEIMIKHLAAAESLYGEYAATKLRKQLMLYSYKFSNSKQFKISICNSSSVKETLSAIKRWQNAA